VRRVLVLCLLAACEPQRSPQYVPTENVEPVPIVEPARPDPGQVGTVVDRIIDFAFDGGQVEFELRRDGNRVIQIARSRYAVPIVMAWQISDLINLEPTTPIEGVAFLPAASAPLREGPAVELADFAIVDPQARIRRYIRSHERFGDPHAEATPYDYGLPYAHGQKFSVLQGFHGSFSHRGSNEYAVDFDCPVATPVVATRPGIVVAANAAAQGAGQTPEYLEYKRTNFVIILHDDGTLGEYMHLSPSGVEVKPGQRVKRGQELALSGNTGFSSTPHLHFQVMTAAEDGISARSFPFQVTVAPGRVEEPVQGHTYVAWE
jgi:murein DD-endopeptidase MepM/ murein hydrolase activator NlpD